MSIDSMWISKDRSASFRWDLVAATRFYPNVESCVSQREGGKEAYPDKPQFTADGISVYYQDALDAHASWLAYQHFPRP